MFHNGRGSQEAIFGDGRRFQGEKGEDHPPCRISVLISDREIRRIFRVYIKPVIGRGDLRVRIIDMGLGEKALRFGYPGWGPGLDVPETEVLEFWIFILPLAFEI